MGEAQHHPVESAPDPKPQSARRAKNDQGDATDTGGDGARHFAWRAPWRSSHRSAAADPLHCASTIAAPKERDYTVRVEQLIAPVSLQLQQPQDKPLSERKRIFRELQRQLHPDKNVEEPEIAKLAFQRLMDHRLSYLAGDLKQ